MMEAKDAAWMIVELCKKRIKEAGNVDNRQLIDIIIQSCDDVAEDCDDVESFWFEVGRELFQNKI